MLLTHTAGFAYPWYQENLLNWVRQQQAGPDPNAYDEFLKYPLVHEPGTTYDYSCALDWAGKVVETVAGTKIEEFCNGACVLELSDARIDLRAAGHARYVLGH